MHPQQEPCQDGHQACVGRVYGDSGSIRYTRGDRDIYARRKGIIERIFGTAKEQHGLRYTQYIGKARMEMKARLTFACMDLKKLARILARKKINGSSRS